MPWLNMQLIPVCQCAGFNLEHGSRSPFGGEFTATLTARRARIMQLAQCIIASTTGRCPSHHLIDVMPAFTHRGNLSNDTNHRYSQGASATGTARSWMRAAAVQRAMPPGSYRAEFPEMRVDFGTRREQGAEA